MDLGKLKHPAWTGIVLPLVFAVGSTFSSRVVRGVLLIPVVILATWAFSKTEFGTGNRISKLIACGVFVVLTGVLVSVLGHVNADKFPKDVSAYHQENRKR
jgi:hypothetical protein